MTGPVPVPGIPDLIEGVERVRQLLCGYVGQPTCDCKFGASGRGEQTGCPELRRVIDFLRSVPSLRAAIGVQIAREIEAEQSSNEFRNVVLRRAARIARGVGASHKREQR